MPAQDLHAIYCPLWAIFYCLFLILVITLAEAARNWHDWRNRHPHFNRTPMFMRRPGAAESDVSAAESGVDGRGDDVSDTAVKPGDEKPGDENQARIPKQARIPIPPAYCVGVTFAMCDGEAYTIYLPAVVPIDDEVRRYMREGVGVTAGAGLQAFYPPHSIVRITLDRRGLAN